MTYHQKECHKSFRLREGCTLMCIVHLKTLLRSSTSTNPSILFIWMGYTGRLLKNRVEDCRSREPQTHPHPVSEFKNFFMVRRWKKLEEHEEEEEFVWGFCGDGTSDMDEKLAHENHSFLLIHPLVLVSNKAQCKKWKSSLAWRN